MSTPHLLCVAGTLRLLRGAFARTRGQQQLPAAGHSGRGTVITVPTLRISRRAFAFYRREMEKGANSCLRFVAMVEAPSSLF